MWIAHPIAVLAGWFPQHSAALLFPCVFPLIPPARLPPLSTQLGARAWPAGGVWDSASTLRPCVPGRLCQDWGGKEGVGVDRTCPDSGAGRAELQGGRPLPTLSLSSSGATSAPCLIFIFPAIFYIRIMPKDKEPLRSTPKILVSMGRVTRMGTSMGSEAGWEPCCPGHP